MGILRNPRWFIDLTAPDRDGPLVSYLGLNPRTLHDILSGCRESRQQQRCLMVLASAALQRVSPDDLTLPLHFLWRIWQQHTLKDHVGGVSRGMLRACQHFIRCLRLLWLEVLRAPDVPLATLVYNGALSPYLQTYEQEALTQAIRQAVLPQVL